MIHTHVYTTTISGEEYGNAKFYENTEAAVKFLGIARGLAHYQDMLSDLTIETVMESLSEDNLGMYVGTSAMVVVISKCGSDHCASPTWN